jgi:hypothetical protein
MSSQTRFIKAIKGEFICERGSNKLTEIKDEMDMIKHNGSEGFTG